MNWRGFSELTVTCLQFLNSAEHKKHQTFVSVVKLMWINYVLWFRAVTKINCQRNVIFEFHSPQKSEWFLLHSASDGNDSIEPKSTAVWFSAASMPIFKPPIMHKRRIERTILLFQFSSHAVRYFFLLFHSIKNELISVLF